MKSFSGLLEMTRRSEPRGGFEPRRFPGRAARILAVLSLAALLAVFFRPLLFSPHRFPAGGSEAGAARAIADGLARARWETVSGEVAQLDPDLGGRNRAADRASFYTHPVYYGLSRLLPGGLSLTLTALLYGLSLGLGAFLFLLELGSSPGAGLFGGAVAMSCGGALGALTSPEGLGAGSAAALVPVLALVLRAVRTRPTLPGVALLATLVSLSAAGGDLAGFLIAVLLALSGALLLERRARPRAGESGRLAASSRPGWLVPAAGLALGLALPAYRTLPLAMGDPAGFFSLAGLGRGPWWLGSSGPLRLPFFLGAITLVAVAAALGGRKSGSWGRRIGAAAALSCLLAPAALLPFLGLPLALAAAAGAERLRAMVPAWAPVGAVLSLALALEAAPSYQARSISISAEELCRAPRWVRFLAGGGRAEKTAVLGADGERFSAPLAAREVARARVGPAAGLDQVEELRPLSYLGARWIVSDLPDTRRRLPLVHTDREEGKYVYLNTAALGPAYWTERVERGAEGGGPFSALTPGLRVPETEGAVAFSAALNLPEIHGDGFGVVHGVERLPSGLRCDLRLDHDAYLVFTERLLAGMEARVDGRAAPLYPANGNQLALLLGAGRHQVRLLYRPAGLAAGIAVSALAAAGLPLLLAAPLLLALARRSQRGREKLAPIRPPAARPARRRAAVSPAGN